MFSKSYALRAIVGLAWASCLVAVSSGDALGATFVLPPKDQALVGTLEKVLAEEKDTLLDVARRHNVGYREIMLANPALDPWLPGAGAEVVLPTRYILPEAPRRGIVLNVAEMRLYYYPRPSKGEPPKVITHPVSIGRGEWETPLGRTEIVKKVADPTWYPPKSVREEHEVAGDPLPKSVPPGPDNPLGQFALRLGLPGYLIHGTNKPFGIGMRVSHGCVRMYPEDIEALFQDVPVGTPVRILNQPYKTSWFAGNLYLEVHPAYGASDQPLTDLTPLSKQLISATRHHPDYPLDWGRAQRAAREPSGIPVPLARPPSGSEGQEGENQSLWLDLVANEPRPLGDPKTGSPK